MSILVAYASKHGATRQIAERIAETLRMAGHNAEARPLKGVGELASYDAFVIGSAAYFGSWLGEAAAFVRRHQQVLASHPVWLFSSGPLGNAGACVQDGGDPREAAVPGQIAEFKQAISPRDHRVFFGALDPSKLGFLERLIRTLPAGRPMLPEGDFRDWPEVEAWANQIARELTPTATAAEAAASSDR